MTDPNEYRDMSLRQRGDGMCIFRCRHGLSESCAFGFGDDIPHALKKRHTEMFASGTMIDGVEIFQRCGHVLQCLQQLRSRGDETGVGLSLWIKIAFDIGNDLPRPFRQIGLDREVLAAAIHFLNLGTTDMPRPRRECR